MIMKPVNKNDNTSEFKEKVSKKYEETCNSNPEWYDLQRYARLLISQGDYSGAILISCRAALAGKQIFEKVNLFEELGNQFLHAGKTTWARDHYSLCIAIREKKRLECLKKTA